MSVTAFRHRLREVSDVSADEPVVDFDQLEWPVQRALLRRLNDRPVESEELLAEHSGEVVRFTTYYRIPEED